MLDTGAKILFWDILKYSKRNVPSQALSPAAVRRGRATECVSRFRALWDITHHEQFLWAKRFINWRDLQDKNAIQNVKTGQPKCHVQWTAGWGMMWASFQPAIHVHSLQISPNIARLKAWKTARLPSSTTARPIPTNTRALFEHAFAMIKPTVVRTYSAPFSCLWRFYVDMRLPGKKNAAPNVAPSTRSELSQHHAGSQSWSGFISDKGLSAGKSL